MRSNRPWLALLVTLPLVFPLGCTDSEAEAELEAQKSLTALEGGDPKKALGLAEKALGLAPNKAVVQEAMGRAALGLRFVDRAIEHLSRAVHLEDTRERRGYLGRAHLWAGNLDEAGEELENALAQKADEIGILQDAIYVFARTGRVREALDLAKRLLARDPHGPSTQIRVASTYLRVGKESQARDLIRTLDESLVEGVQDLLVLGGVYYELGQSEASIRVFERALEKHPEDVGLRYNLGTALIQAEKYREALPHFEKAREKHPEDPKILGQLALCLSKIGRRETAMKLLLVALEKSPEDSILQEMLVKLQTR